jgi:hypothetical protein
MAFEIMPATMTHMRIMARTMRAEDRDEIESLGVAPRRLLRALYRESTHCGAATLAGELAAVWGCQGELASSVGMPWLFTAPPVERAPLAFFKETRGQVMRMLVTRRELVTDVLATYQRSLRFFAMMGFAIGEPFPAGPHGALYRRIRLERG